MASPYDGGFLKSPSILHICGPIGASSLPVAWRRCVADCELLHAEWLAFHSGSFTSFEISLAWVVEQQAGLDESSSGLSFLVLQYLLMEAPKHPGAFFAVVWQLGHSQCCFCAKLSRWSSFEGIPVFASSSLP